MLMLLEKNVMIMSMDNYKEKLIIFFFREKLKI